MTRKGQHKAVILSEAVIVRVTPEVKQALDNTTPDEIRELLRKYAEAKESAKAQEDKNIFALFSPEVKSNLLEGITADQVRGWLTQIAEARKSGHPCVLFVKPWGESEALRYVSLLYLGQGVKGKEGNHEPT